MSASVDLLYQFRLRPPQLPSRPKIPAPGIHIQVSFQDNDILRPAVLHSLRQCLRVTFIHPVKVPHPAEAAGGEAGPVGIVCGDILRRHHSGPFLRPAAHQPAQFQVQFHLWEVGSKGPVDSGIKPAVINALANVHMTSPFRACSPIFDKAKEKTVTLATVLCFDLSLTPLSPALFRPRTAGRQVFCLWRGPSPCPPAGGWCFPPTV